MAIPLRFALKSDLTRADSLFIDFSMDLTSRTAVSLKADCGTPKRLRHHLKRPNNADRDEMSSLCLGEPPPL